MRKTLIIAIPLAAAICLLLAVSLLLNSGGAARAAPSRQNPNEEAPAFRALTVTASIPISDTRPGEGVTKTVYFNNSTDGAITLTVDLTGTPPLTLAAGPAFDQTEESVYISQNSPATFVVAYKVSTHGDQTAIFTATNRDGLEATVALTFVQDIAAPTAAIVTPTADLWISTTLPIAGTAADNEGGSGLAEVKVTTGTAWVAPEGLANWNYAWTPPSGQNGVAYTFIVSAVDFVRNAATATRRITVDNWMTGTVSHLTSTTHLTGVWSNQ
ncbi:MAG: hypothetical protein NZ769_11700, partial [Anaerolineae bacterium]|nr:hypothetical protein [Anaerolineae bacterium]